MKAADLRQLRSTRARVVALFARHVRIPLRTTIRHASFSRKSSDNVVVECRLDDGTIGFGEGVPRDYVTGETVETSLSLLRRADYDGQFEAAANFDDAATMVRRFRLPRVPGDARDCVGNAARCAAELALLDAFGKHFGASLWTLAERTADFQPIACSSLRCRYSAALTSKSRPREIWSCIKFLLGGFNQCKVKVGTDGQDDVTRLAMFRRILGAAADIRIDANEAWNTTNIVDKIRDLEPYGISAVEQPLPHLHVAALAEVRRQVAVPIVHDESLCSRIDGERAIRDQTCDLFNIRLSKCGGLFPSMDLALLAHEAGLGYQLGCQVGETGILSAAGRHFACSIKNIRYLEGSYDRWLVRERLTHEDITFHLRGVAPALRKPGLGVSVDRRSLDRVTISREQVYG